MLDDTQVAPSSPPVFGASPPPKWKDCDSLAVVKTQREFLARAQTEQKVHIEAQKLVPAEPLTARAITVTNGPLALLQIV